VNVWEAEGDELGSLGKAIRRPIISLSTAASSVLGCSWLVARSCKQRERVTEGEASPWSSTCSNNAFVFSRESLGEVREPHKHF